MVTWDSESRWSRDTLRRKQHHVLFSSLEWQVGRSLCCRDHLALWERGILVQTWTQSYNQHVRKSHGQPRMGIILGFQVKVLETFQVVPSSLGSGVGTTLLSGSLAPGHDRTTRWSTTLPSNVNLPDAMNFVASSGENLVT